MLLCGYSQGRALNDALGQPLDTPHMLTSPLSALDLPDLALATWSIRPPAGVPKPGRPIWPPAWRKLKPGKHTPAMLPRVSVRGAFEADHQRFVDRGAANWLVAISLRWNLFNGSADKARIAETGHLGPEGSTTAH